jgi:hypothetical protein
MKPATPCSVSFERRASRHDHLGAVKAKRRRWLPHLLAALALIEEVGTRVWHFERGEIRDFKGPYEEYGATLPA